MPKKLVPARAIRTERERSGPGRASYAPQSRTVESNMRRRLRRTLKLRPSPRAGRAAADASAAYDEVRRFRKGADRGTTVKRSSVYSTSESYYRGSRGSIRGGYIEGSHGETTDRARRGMWARQDETTQRRANVKRKKRGWGPQRRRQSDQGATGQRKG